MKIIELIQKLEDIRILHGNIEVFIEYYGFNCEEILEIKGVGFDGAYVEDLNIYPKEYMMEEHGNNSGLIKSVIINTDEKISHYG